VAQLVRVPHAAERRRGETGFLQESLLGDAVLRDGHGADRRAHGGLPRQALKRGGRDVLELGRDGPAGPGQLVERALSVYAARRCRLATVPAGLVGSGSRTTTWYPMDRARSVNMRPS
jgi:hypothetical protein